MPAGERAVLLLTFALTIFVDLTVAIAVGVTIASLLFVARMSAAVELQQGLDPDHFDSEDPDQRQQLPKGVEVFRLSGPLFFGVAGELLDALRRIGQGPRVIILRLRQVPYMDASAAASLQEFAHQAKASGCSLVLSGVQPQPKEMLARAGLGAQTPGISFAPGYAEAIPLAAAIADTGAELGR
jgi:SulP family sulfate permease